MAKAAASLEETSAVGFNSGMVILGIASDMLGAELASRRGHVDVALHRLEAAVAAEDGLRYNEPADWPLPVRHYLGAALLAAGRLDQAEAVYREDLKRHPENGWSLFGLAAVLEQRPSPEAAAVTARLQKAWSRADLKLTGSRF